MCEGSVFQGSLKGHEPTMTPKSRESHSPRTDPAIIVMAILLVEMSKIKKYKVAK